MSDDDLDHDVDINSDEEVEKLDSDDELFDPLEQELLDEKADELENLTGLPIDTNYLKAKKYAPNEQQIIIVAKHKRLSSQTLSQFELTQVIGVMATHIQKGHSMIPAENLTNARDIAIEQLIQKKCPLMIKRYMTPQNSSVCYVEIWDVNEMDINPQHLPETTLGV
jgi:hypothetical protein